MFKIRFFPLSVSWSAFFCLPLHTVQRNTLYVRVLKLIFLFHSLCIAFLYGMAWYQCALFMLVFFWLPHELFSLINFAPLLHYTTYIRAVGENVCIWNAQRTWTFGSLQHTHICWWHSVCSALQCTNDTFYDELALVLLSVASTGFFILFYVFISLSNHSRSLCVCFCLV